MQNPRKEEGSATTTPPPPPLRRPAAVGFTPELVTEEMLQSYYEPCGTIQRLKLHPPQPGKRGVAFVTFEVRRSTTHNLASQSQSGSRHPSFRQFGRKPSVIGSVSALRRRGEPPCNEATGGWSRSLASQ